MVCYLGAWQVEVQIWPWQLQHLHLLNHSHSTPARREEFFCWNQIKKSPTLSRFDARTSTTFSKDCSDDKKKAESAQVTWSNCNVEIYKLTKNLMKTVNLGPLNLNWFDFWFKKDFVKPLNYFDCLIFLKRAHQQDRLDQL